MAMTLQAVTEIHRTIKPGINADKAKGTPAIPPQVQVIKPTSLFEARNQQEYDELTAGDRPAAMPYSTKKVKVDEAAAAKAVRQISGGSTVVEPQHVEDPNADDTPVDLPDEDALNKLTKAQIVAQAGEEGLELSEDGNTKADLVKAVLDHRVETNGEELL